MLYVHAYCYIGKMFTGECVLGECELGEWVLGEWVLGKSVLEKILLIRKKRIFSFWCYEIMFRNSLKRYSIIKLKDWYQN